MTHRYNRPLMVRELAIASFMLVLGVLPIVLEAHIVVLVPAWAITLLAAYRLVSLMLDFRTELSWNADGLHMSQFRQKQIAWSDVTDLRLRYFGNRKSMSQAGYHLTLKHTQGKARIHGGLDDFPELMLLLRKQSLDHGWATDPVSDENLAELLRTLSSRDNSALPG